MTALFSLKTQLRKPSTAGLWEQVSPREWRCGNVSILETTGKAHRWEQSWIILVDGEQIETDGGRDKYGSASQAKIGASLMAAWERRRKR